MLPLAIIPMQAGSHGRCPQTDDSVSEAVRLGTGSSSSLRVIQRLVLLSAVFVPMSGLLSAAERTGEEIYRQECQRCHGVNGVGTDKLKKPLAGDQSIKELTRVIGKTMPEDDPESLSSEEATAVAAYIHGAFYSPTAQDRIRPARIELSRLTVRQYQNTVTDLLAGFGEGVRFAQSKERGLRAEYFKNRRMNKENRVIERIDPKIEFDFGEGSPDQDKIEPAEFAMRWNGALRVEETGEYEFTVRTEHAARLWLNNDRNQPLIDAWVKSGTDTEYKATVSLLGGRDYPLRLEYSKSKQGVDDGKKIMAGRSSITLLWQIPGRIREPIPQRNLIPDRVPEQFVLTTRFPADDRSVGYERGNSVSAGWDEATTEAAIEVADAVDRFRERLTGAADNAGDREAKYRDFATRWVERTFRRPLSPELKALYVDQQFQGQLPLDVSLRRVVLLSLKSPRFLFREVGQPSDDPYAIASRLSYDLWDSMPDRELLETAANGSLQKRDVVVRQAQRMMKDRRAMTKLRQFFLQWLKVDQVAELSKESQEYPDFTPEVANDLRRSLDLFLDEVLTSDAADFRKLLLADEIPLNGRLAKFYGVDLPAEAAFQPVKLNGDVRAGVLTHPYLLSAFAYRSASSPIHRGVWISRSLLGRKLKPPPEAVAPLARELQPDLTTRERVTLQTQSETCLACHGMINPLGYTLEQFDAVGRFRMTELNKPVNAVGSYIARDGATAELNGPRGLAQYLVTSDETQAAIVEQMFQYLVKQPIRAYGENRLQDLKTKFVANGYNLRELAVEIAVSAALGADPATNASAAVTGEVKSGTK